MTARETVRFRRLALVVVAVSLGQGCAGATARQAPPGGAAESRQSGPRHGPPHTAADAEFVRHMLLHHQQALEMTALVPERARSEAIRLLAERIEVSQRDEIARMEQWLRVRGEHVPGTGMDHPTDRAVSEDHAEMHARHHGPGGAMLMPGMLTPEEMARLEAASGAAFDRLFLESMIRHHEGALVMVAELFASPGAGQETEIYQLASEVDSDQRMEIDRMRRMLDALTG